MSAKVYVNISPPFIRKTAWSNLKSLAFLKGFSPVKSSSSRINSNMLGMISKSKSPFSIFSSYSGIWVFNIGIKAII